LVVCRLWTELLVEPLPTFAVIGRIYCGVERLALLPRMAPVVFVPGGEMKVRCCDEHAISGLERCEGGASRWRGFTVLALHKMVRLTRLRWFLQRVTQLLATTPSERAALLSCVSEAARNIEKSPANEQVEFSFSGV
jgi:hypothetical protein